MTHYNKIINSAGGHLFLVLKAILLIVLCWLTTDQVQAQTALKWSAYLSDNYKIEPQAIYLDENTDRLYVAGSVRDPSYSSSLGNTYSGGEDDAAIVCLSSDGTTVHWMAYLGGSGREYITAISTNAEGDVFIGGTTTSPDFPVNGQISPYDPTFNTTIDNNNFVTFLARLSPDGATLKYSTFIGGQIYVVAQSMVVSDDMVYYGATMASGETFPVTAGAFQTTSKGGDSEAALFALNTGVGGTAGLEWATYLGGTQTDELYHIKLAPDGQLVLAGLTIAAGDGTEDFPVTANAIQTPTSLNDGITSNATGQFISKFTTSGALTYSTMLFPVSANSIWTDGISLGMDVDKEGGIYTIQYIDHYGAFNPAPSQQISTISGSSYENMNVVSKISADLSPILEYTTILASDYDYSAPVISVDDKNRAHVLMHTTKNFREHFETDGHLPDMQRASQYSYGILSSAGNTVEYMTDILETFAYYYMDVSSDGTAYLTQRTAALFSDRSENFFTTPSYYDFDTGTQKTVFNSTVINYESADNGTIMVMHSPLPNNNTITDFASDNNTFCVDGLIYQNPNEGPILGSTPDYQSGDGASATHNLPDLYTSRTGSTVAHPNPGSPELKFQWEKSYDGTIWETISGENLAVLKPAAESAAATVRYRRLTITAACDTLISNLATATIAGTFSLAINVSSEPIYYCPGTLKDLGMTITGVSGNISWQWYNGFAPLTTEITPASGSNVAAGSFSAAISTTATEGGSYRLVVTDAGGCKKEAFVTIEPLTAPVSMSAAVAICPGTTPSVVIGPAATNPDFDYSWTGPGGYTSTEATPTVTTAGTYTLQVKLKTDASFCAGGATSVTVNGAVPHDDALTTIANSEFCQSDSPAPIGLSGAPPTDYVFQWVPGTNLDNAQAYSPNFDPGSLPFNVTPVSEIAYTFTALRLEDGCIFETTTMVTDTARALAQAGIDKPSCGNFQEFGAVETDGNYWEWRAVGTTYPGDLAAFTAHTDFSMDGSTTNLGTNKFLTGGFPSHSACYTIDYEIKAAYVPFPTNCFTRDTVRLFYCPTCDGDWCSDLTSNNQGTDGACSGTNSIIGGIALDGLTYTWTTYSVDGVVQAANAAPQGLFEVNADGTKGAAFAGGAAHSAKAIADFDDGSWGWAGSNVVIYRLTGNGNYGAGVIDCHRDIQVFSAADATPVIGVLDQAFCTVEAPAVRLGSAGKDAPYTISGIDYTQAPNSGFDWQWSVVDGTTGSLTSGETTPFPTMEPTAPTKYEVVVIDPVTGCRAIDTIFADVVPVITNAGADILSVCNGTLVQLGAAAQVNHTYSWNPTVGLNDPINTPNSMAAEPYLLVGSAATYTVTVTESTSGCQATDAMDVTTTTSAPPTPSANTYNGCSDGVFEIGPDSYTTLYVTYNWTAQSGTADIAWLSATDVLNPTVALPNSFTGPATFRLTVTQGSCPSSFQDYVINDNSPAPNLGANVNYDCTTSTIQISNGFNAGYEYAWTPTDGLYSNSGGTSVYDGNFSTNWYRIYAAPNTTTTFTLHMRDVETGCIGTDDIIVTVPTTVAADAGGTVNYCPESGSVAINASGTGGSFAWTATGYSSNPYEGSPGIPSSGEETTMLGYLSATTGLSINFEQTSLAPGKYVYTLTATDGACSTTDELTVIVPEIGTANLAGVSTSVCEGQSVQLGVSNPSAQFAFAWRAINPTSEDVSISGRNSPNPTVSPSVTTTYELTTTDALSGCSETNTVTVSVTPKPVVSDVDIAVQCAPIGNIDLTAQIPSYGAYFNQVWYQNSVPGTVVTTPTVVSPTETTDYFVILENEFACPDTARVTVNVENPQTPIIISNVATYCPTNSIDLTDHQGTPSDPAYTLEWHTDNTTNSATLLSSTVVIDSGTYYLFETTPNGCSNGSSNLIYSAETCCPAQQCGTVTITINNN